MFRWISEFEVVPCLGRVIVDLTAEARIRSQVSPRKIRGEPRGIEHNFLRVLRLSHD